MDEQSYSGLQGDVIPPLRVGLPNRKLLGRLPAKSDTRALHFAKFASPPKALPPATNFWNRRAGFPPRTFGNTECGDCTRAKQAVASMRMERLETRRTIEIDDQEVVRVYYEMTGRLYGGGDTGAYEDDALSAWRKPDETFHDTKGRALTIDAFLRINAANHEEKKSGLVTAGAHGIAICINLPLAFQRIEPPADWDIPEGQALVGEWEPGSWGGHSMWETDYDPIGFWLEHTWGYPRQRITYRAAAAYIDEAHLVVDSYDYWRMKRPEIRKLLDFGGIKKAVNAVSATKID